MNEHRNSETEPKKSELEVELNANQDQGLEDQNTLFYSSDERIDRTPHRT